MSRPRLAAQTASGEAPVSARARDEKDALCTAVKRRTVVALMPSDGDGDDDDGGVAAAAVAKSSWAATAPSCGAVAKPLHATINS